MAAAIGSFPDGQQWDPAATRRGEEDWIRGLWESRDSRVAMFRDGEVAVAADGAAAWATGADVGERPEAWAFLGLDDAGAPRFAATVTQAPASAGAASWQSPRGLAPDAAGQLLGAMALMNWHSSHPRCPRCGSATRGAEAGWQRVCESEGSRHFPRVDPAVIMLVHDGGERALLARQRRWPPGWFSTLAGFVEPGESLEAAVAREVAEEVGLTVTSAQYRASQPWPFPNSLMLGFMAQADAGDPAPDGDEISEANWVTRESLARDCASGLVRLPPALSISRWLIQQWYGAELPGDWTR